MPCSPKRARLFLLTAPPLHVRLRAAVTTTAPASNLTEYPNRLSKATDDQGGAQSRRFVSLITCQPTDSADWESSAASWQDNSSTTRRISFSAQVLRKTRRRGAAR